MMFDFLNKKFIDESLVEQEDDFKKNSPDFYKEAIKSKSCDSLFNDKKGFGLIGYNPIPVNGPLGEMKYLNRLRCKCGVGLIYHRLRSMEIDKITNPVDIYETVCIEGKHWNILFFDFYHPRRSVWLPEGFTFSDFHPIFSRYPIGFGTNNFSNDFPFGLDNEIGRIVGFDENNAFVKKYEKIIENKSKFIKPRDHKTRLSILEDKNKN